MNNVNGEGIKRGPGRPRVATVETEAVVTTRQKLGMSQEQFAREMGCSLAAVRKMESEHRLPGSYALRTAFDKLAQRAGVEVE